MPTIQIQKTRSSATISKTAIDQKQSLEVVQTMLHGGLSTLCYLRNFFAEKAFDLQVYGMSERIHPYEDYASGKLATRKESASETSTTMQVLRRNRSKRVDMFLDWLENGAFTALQAGNLRSLQIYVHPDPNCREKVIETYTFNIKYHPHTRDGGQVLAGLEMGRPTNSLVTVGATNGALQILMRQIMNVCESLPNLPDKRFISVALFYVHETEVQIPPKGFIPNAIESLFFGEAEGWEKRTANAELHSGLHSTFLKISHLQQTGCQPYNGVTKMRPPPFPMALQYKVPVDQRDNVESYQSTDRIAEVSDVVRTNEDRAVTTTPSTIIDSEHARELTEPADQSKAKEQIMITPIPTSDLPAPVAVPQDLARDIPNEDTVAVANAWQARLSQLSENLNTQSSGIPEMKFALKTMMQPEHITQGDTQTQWFPPPPPSRTESTDTSELGDESPTIIAKPASPVKGNKAMLSQSVAKDLKKAKASLRDTTIQLAKAGGRQKKVSDLVLCQCGSTAEEGDMVNCVYCGTWQHLHCYGYTSARDPRLPVDHVCYQCLLGGREKQTLKELQELTLKRRAMHFALRNGLKTQRDLAAAMGCPTSIAGTLHQYLKKERYVVAATGSHSAGYSSSGKPLFVAARDGETQQRMLANLFDPLTYISHYYELPAKIATQATALTQQLRATQASNMPPPVTPASRFNRAAAKTPGSGLDLANSITPFETPSRPRSCQTMATKRHRGSGDDAGTPAKRRVTHSLGQRLRSVQSEFVLDAGGLSSSPVGSVLGH